MSYIKLIACFIVNIIICFGIPVGYLIYIIISKKKMLKPFFTGVLVFIISQVFLRIPILKYILPKMDWYSMMTALYPIINCIFLGVTAGLFEETGRFLGFKLLLKKNRSWLDGLSFAMGHGGIEAMLLTGVSSLQNAIVLISLNSGKYNAELYGISEVKINEMFKAVTSPMILIGGIERILAIIIHIGLTFIILYGINQRKKMYLGLAVLIHAVIDSITVIITTSGFSVYAAEIWVTVCAVLLLIYSIKIKNKFKGDFINENII